MERRLEVVEQMLMCDKCELVNQCHSPVAFFGPAPCDIAVVGEAPGEQEDEQGRPFVGPAGQLIRKHLQEVEIDPDEVAWVNTVSCFPHGTPELAHVTACADNKNAQLDLIKPTFILLLGRTALFAQEPNTDAKYIRGRPFVKNGIINFPTFHPAAALRNRNFEKAMAEDLELFARITNGESWRQFVGEKCVMCGDWAEWFADGLLKCAKHLPDEAHQRLAFVTKQYEATKRRLHPEQLTMEGRVAS